MNYEKAYKEALEIAREIHNGNPSSGTAITVCEQIFPELAESKDERIKKALIQIFNVENFENYDIKNEEVIAWIEKQGKNNIGISEATKKELEDNLNKVLEKETPESWNEFLEKQGEQKPAWSEEDEEHLNSIIGDIKTNMGAYPRSQEVIDIYNDDISFLKHLKDRYAWKPSELQIEALESATENCAYSEYQNCLQELLEQLKAL